MLDASARVRTIRMVGSGAVGVSLIVSAPWLGWWTFLLFALSALNFLSVDRRMACSDRPERVSVRAILVTLALLAAGVTLSGGPASPALPWLVLPAAMVAARFRPQVVAVGVTLTIAVILAVTLGLDTHATLRHPVPVFSTLALLVAVVSIVRALQSAELDQRGAATADPLTGLANRRQLADDLNAVWAQASSERPVRLVLFDLDGFKAYNDNFGHLGGDMLLVASRAPSSERSARAARLPPRRRRVLRAAVGRRVRGDGRRLPAGAERRGRRLLDHELLWLGAVADGRLRDADGAAAGGRAHVRAQGLQPRERGRPDAGPRPADPGRPRTGAARATPRTSASSRRASRAGSA